MNLSTKSIMLIDGDCVTCSATVNFTIPRDPQGKIVFATLQSEVGQQLLKQHGLPTSNFKSFVLIDGGVALIRSAAALSYFRKLDGLWPLLTIFALVPQGVRDFIYDFIAAHRYQLFGKRETCFVPTDEIRQRFLL